MKLNFRYHVTAFAVAVAVLVGCRNEEPASKEASSPAISAAARDVQKDIDAAKTFVAENKDQFLAVSEKQLQTVDSAISELAKKSEGYQADAKAQADKVLATLKEKRETVTKRYDDLKAASKDAWVNLKSGFNSALEDLQKALDEARAKFN